MDWSIVQQYLPFYQKAFFLTLHIAVLGILGSFLLGLVVSVIRHYRVPVFVGMVITAVIGIVCGAAFGLKGMPALPDTFFEMNFHLNAAGSFMDGFGELFANPLNAFVVIFSFLFVDFFDTAGTLVAVAKS